MPFFLLLFLSLALAYTPGDECISCYKPITPSEYTHFYNCDHIDVHNHCNQLWTAEMKEKTTCTLCRASPLESLIPFPSEIGEDLNDCNEQFYNLGFGKYLIEVNEWAALETYLSLCISPMEVHYHFMELEAVNSRWDMLSRHMSKFKFPLSFYHMNPAFEIVAREELRTLMTQILNKTIDGIADGQKERSHVECIHNGNFECSNAFIDYYTTSQVVVDITQSVKMAVWVNMDVVTLDRLLGLLSQNATIYHDQLAEALVACSNRDKVKEGTLARFELLFQRIDKLDIELGEFQQQIILETLIQKKAIHTLELIFKTSRFKHSGVNDALQRMKRSFHSYDLNKLLAAYLDRTTLSDSLIDIVTRS